MSGWRIVQVELGAAGDDAEGQAAPAARTLIVFPSGSDGEAMAGLLAARWNAVLLGRLSGIVRDGEDLVVTRPAYGGRIGLELRVTGGVAVATMNEPIGDAEILSVAPVRSEVQRVPLPARKAALEGARIVISGGRGLDSEAFAVLDKIADRIDGALGASLPAVDLGLAPVSRQIGQSGNFVTPRLYLAAGISGTPQHLAGIGTATQIIAINKDADAPIFRFAEIGLVIDARDLLPELLRSIEEIAA
ncbi:electron transfer flavoprotein subunit alpha/FixB family protein [Sphingobium estronivorans]|uniref:electron transfer flavoprotein subunit alpha/FixB family protein n=1 Tax=Sphingobium estronivorans TaxID=1577690 RepID=UPI00123BC554|nr:electron transfer flavoprotein subunit alpha/FixB family protein [Sphingobium estronivorans]